MADELKASENAPAQLPSRWITNDECHSPTFKYTHGEMKYVLKHVTFNTGDVDGSMSLQFIRAKDQKVYVRKCTHAECVRLWKSKSAAEIREWFETPAYVIPLSQECVLILEDPDVYHTSTKRKLIAVTLREKVSQKSEEARAIEERLTNEIESLKRAHREEIESMTRGHREEIMEIRGWASGSIPEPLPKKLKVCGVAE